LRVSTWQIGQKPPEGFPLAELFAFVEHTLGARPVFLGLLPGSPVAVNRTLFMATNTEKNVPADSVLDPVNTVARIVAKLANGINLGDLVVAPLLFLGKDIFKCAHIFFIDAA
jgi:hypothetical protein